MSAFCRASRAYADGRQCDNRAHSVPSAQASLNPLDVEGRLTSAWCGAAAMGAADTSAQAMRALIASHAGGMAHSDTRQYSWHSSTFCPTTMRTLKELAQNVGDEREGQTSSLLVLRFTHVPIHEADLSLVWGCRDGGCRDISSSSACADCMRDMPPRTRPSSLMRWHLSNSDSLLFERAVSGDSARESRMGLLATGLMLRESLLGYACMKVDQRSPP